ncbi:hypothetical protein SDC9_208796 [bioreactor metagenome]|uniref:Uncharacterized protein n=1 Tax=bioreactor metagenome TaxID=1076179 RepID=A0A645JD14_9ZZZZ
MVAEAFAFGDVGEDDDAQLDLFVFHCILDFGAVHVVQVQTEVGVVGAEAR